MYKLLWFLFLSLPIAGISQRTNITGSIAGTLLDSITRQPVEYAAVGIIDMITRKVVDGAITDDEGKFRIDDLPMQPYEIQVNFVGYTPKTIKNVILSAEKPHYNAFAIYLAPEVQLLEEIRVLGEAALIEAKPDKIVYNAERDVTTAGGDASDVLRKVPLLTVDLDGNVSLRGSGNVRILVNGRPSGMFSSDVAEALKMMPADQIKSVEVITSPSAKYDGEGTAGIINIITKKKNIEGVAGSVDLTAGTRSNRANGNLNYGKGRFGLNISGGGHYSRPQTGESIFRREETTPGDASFLSQDGLSTSSRLGYRVHGGIEYNPSPSSSINTSVTLREFTHENENDVAAVYSINGNTIDAYDRLSDGISSRKGFDWELDYKLNFPKEGKEWSIALEVDNDLSNSDFDYLQEYSFPASLSLVREQNLNDRNNLEITLQTDYTHPFSDKVKFETGLKGTLRQIESDFQFQSFDPDLEQWQEVAERTDIFYYDQNVYAAYGSAVFQIGESINLIAGLRAELTDLQGSFEKFNSPFDNEYLSFLPNATISRKTGEFNLIKLSYNQRIQRPNQRHINPFIEYNDNRDISFGNPLLFPEKVHQVEFGSTFFIDGNMLNISLFGRRTEDLIENLLTIDNNGISSSTFYNFGQRSAVGVNVFGSLNLGEHLTLRGGVDVNAWKIDGDFGEEFLTNSGYDYNGRMNLTWSVTESLRVEGFTYFHSPYYTVQGKNPSWSMMSLGLKQELFKRRLTIGINVTEPFRENHIMERELEGDGFTQYSRSVRPIRSFGVNVGFRFGKLDFKERSGKKQINNNDLKEEYQGEPSMQGG